MLLISELLLIGIAYFLSKLFSDKPFFKFLKRNRGQILTVVFGLYLAYDLLKAGFQAFSVWYILLVLVGICYWVYDLYQAKKS